MRSVMLQPISSNFGSGPQRVGQTQFHWAKTLDGVLRCFLVAAAAISLLGCDQEAKHPIAGQVIKPPFYGSGGGSESSDTTNISLYEYSDKQNYKITGESIHFTIPKYFTIFSTNREGGPQSSIDLRYIPEGDRAHALRFFPSKEEWQKADASAVDIYLTSYNKDPSREKNVVLAGKSNELMDGLMDRPSLQIQSTPFCSRLALTRVGPSPANEERHSAPDRGARSKEWPFGEAVVFVRPDGEARFNTLTTCTKFVRADGFPLCAIRSNFRGWPMRLLFSGSRVCHVEELISHSRAFLDRFVSKETPRSPGTVDTRHSDSNNGSF